MNDIIVDIIISKTFIHNPLEPCKSRTLALTMEATIGRSAPIKMPDFFFCSACNVCSLKHNTKSY